MFHKQRRWCVGPVASAEELAHKLTTTTWCGCTGFELDGYLFLNDSTSPDAVQEFAIVKRTGCTGQLVQIESITFGWCDLPKALDYIRSSLAGHFDQSDFAHDVAPRLETHAQHGRCSHCA